MTKPFLSSSPSSGLGRRFLSLLGVSVGLILLAQPTAADADMDADAAEKRFKVGAGLKSLVVTNNVWGADDERLSGVELFFTGSPPDLGWLGFNGNLYFLRHRGSNQLSDDVYAVGFEGEVQAGLNVAKEGFKVYGVIGFYAENWSNGDFDENFSGVHLGVGLGYNWRDVSLDVTFRGRTTRDYDNFLRDLYGPNAEAAAGTASVTVGYRF